MPDRDANGYLKWDWERGGINLQAMEELERTSILMTPTRRRKFVQENPQVKESMKILHPEDDYD